jgi:hypothetical protein
MFENAEVISTYSRKQAIEDGVLVDVSCLAKEAGFKYPVAITNSVEGLIQQAISNPKYGNDYNGVLWDILWVLRLNIRKSSNVINFSLVITGVGGSNYHQFKAVCGPGDNLEPVITIMLPEED